MRPQRAVSTCQAEMGQNGQNSTEPPSQRMGVAWKVGCWLIAVVQGIRLQQPGVDTGSSAPGLCSVLLLILQQPGSQSKTGFSCFGHMAEPHGRFPCRHTRPGPQRAALVELLQMHTPSSRQRSLPRPCSRMITSVQRLWRSAGVSPACLLPLGPWTSPLTPQTCNFL